MLYYDEVFLSIQGESKDSGLPTIFVRLFGCPFKCTYCDQPQTTKTKASIGTLLVKIKSFRNVDRVCITGGEPMLQDDCLPLAYELVSMGYKVSIETSGCVAIPFDTYKRSFRYVMDVKGPSSGPAIKHNKLDNLINLQSCDEVKFVVKDREDYEYMKKILRNYPTSASILVSPMFQEDNTMYPESRELVSWILEDKLDVRVQVQIHKMLQCK